MLGEICGGGLVGEFVGGFVGVGGVLVGLLGVLVGLGGVEGCFFVVRPRGGWRLRGGPWRLLRGGLRRCGELRVPWKSPVTG